MSSEAQSGGQDRFSLGPQTTARLAEAQYRLGGLALLARSWAPWTGLARGPLTALAACDEARLRGKEADLAELAALGPDPEPSRPNQGLRWAAGFVLALRRLEDPRVGPVLGPSAVNMLYRDIEAPFLARGWRGHREAEAPQIPGSPVWALAPRWRQAGLPRLMCLGLALASWEREGPDDPRRAPAGRALTCALAQRLELPPEGFFRLGRCLEEVAQRSLGGLAKVQKEVRKTGSWRPWLEVFLPAVQASAAWAAEVGLAAQAMAAEHADLVTAWVHAPKNPLRLLTLLLSQPVIDLPGVANQLDVTQRTAGLLVDKLAELSLVSETTGQKRGRKFAYTPLLNLLDPAAESTDDSRQPAGD